MTPKEFQDKYGQILQKTSRSNAQLGCPYTPELTQPEDIAIDPGSSLRDKFKCYGLHYQDKLRGVRYRQGYITYVQLPDPSFAAISYEFSGCYMAKLCFDGRWYVFHVSTSPDAEYDCKKEWREFLSDYGARITDVVVYDPTQDKGFFERYCALVVREDVRITVACVLDAQSRGYALILDCLTGAVYANDQKNIMECNPTYKSPPKRTVSSIYSGCTVM